MSTGTRAQPAAGYDSGRVNAGCGGILFYGAKQLIGADGDGDGAENTAGKTIPHFDITGAERWDIERGIIYRPSADWQSMDKVVVDPPSVRGTKPKEMQAHISRMVPKSQWLFEAAPSLTDGTPVLPLLVVENQSDFVDRDAPKNAKGEQKLDYRKSVLGPLANHWANTVQTCDAVKFDDRYPKRERVGGMSKYGLRCDGSRERPERKEEATEQLLELLSEMGTPNSLQWFDWFTLMQQKGEQIHDMCDALSLAVQFCYMRYKKQAKVELRKLELQQREDIKKRRALLNSIQLVPTRPKTVKAPRAKKAASDGSPATKKAAAPKKTTEKRNKTKKASSSSSSSDIDVGKKKKKKTSRAPRKKKNDDDDDVDDDDDDQASKKKKKKKKSSKKRKKGDAASSGSGDDVVIVMSKDPVKKKSKKEPKYPMLLLEEPLRS